MRRQLANEGNALRRAGPQTGPMPHHFGLLECRQQFFGRCLEAFQRIIGRCLVESGVFQRAANQDMPITPRDRIATLGQYHAWQKILGTLVENHLPFHWLDRQLQPKRLEQLTTPGAGRQDHALGTNLATSGSHATNLPILLNETSDRAMLTQLHVRHGCQSRP